MGGKEGMLEVDRLVASFLEIVGWPYASPGTNDEAGIDCSGAFVRAYRAQGAEIYHGSNRIARAHCRNVFPLADAAALRPGMAVFKVRQDGGEPGAYKPGGTQYSPEVVGNVYHAGLVCGVNPLRIVHATTPFAKEDGALGQWALAGWLTAVAYPAQSAHPAGAAEFPYEARAEVGDSERGLNFRTAPNRTAARVARCPEIPGGARVVVLAHANGEWARVQFGQMEGYVMREYLRQGLSGGGAGPEDARALLALIDSARRIVAGWTGAQP
ncbi:hypothetical protein FACS1894196_2330 [Clostridia bacterium]|nr:hypothetical protein FACS1894196_2330 [Clostridia bacterium]